MVRQGSLAMGIDHGQELEWKRTKKLKLKLKLWE